MEYTSGIPFHIASIRHVIVYVPPTDHSTEIVLAGAPVSPETTRETLVNTVIDLLNWHSDAINQLLDIHCIHCACHFSNETPKRFLLYVAALKKCCDECHADEDATAFAALVCSKKVCRRNARRLLSAWADRHVRQNVKNPDDHVERLRICGWCARAQFVEDFAAAGNFKRCSGCHETYYCGPACQNKAWPMHKKVCIKRV